MVRTLPNITNIILSIFILLFCIRVSTFSQEDEDNIKSRKEPFSRDKSEFYDIFSRELNQKKRKNEKEPQFIASTADPIPENLFSRIGKYPDSTVVVGISDPFMESEKAKQLAVHRALVSFIILNQSKISHVLDYYTHSKKARNYSRLEELGNIKSFQNNDQYKYEILVTHRTHFNETIVIVSVYPRHLGAKSFREIDFRATFYQITDFTSRGPQRASEITYKSTSKNLSGEDKTTSFTLVSNGNSPKYQTSALDTTMQTEKLFLKYRSESGAHEPPHKPSMISCSVNKGLWAAYISLILDAIFYETGKLRSVIKNVSEGYASNIQSLKRNIYQNTSSFDIHKMFIKKNKMFIDLKIYHPAQKMRN